VAAGLVYAASRYFVDQASEPVAATEPVEQTELVRCWSVLAASLNPEPDQLALDASVAPARVLARQVYHELTQLRSRWQGSRTPMRTRPTARNQLAMPTQDRRRPHEQRQLFTPAGEAHG